MITTTTKIGVRVIKKLGGGRSYPSDSGEGTYTRPGSLNEGLVPLPLRH